MIHCSTTIQFFLKNISIIQTVKVRGGSFHSYLCFLICNHKFSAFHCCIVVQNVLFSGSRFPGIKLYKNSYTLVLVVCLAEFSYKRSDI